MITHGLMLLSTFFCCTFTHTNEHPSTPLHNLPSPITGRLSPLTTMPAREPDILSPEERRIAEDVFRIFATLEEEDQKRDLAYIFQSHQYNAVPFIIVADENEHTVLQKQSNYAHRSWLERVLLDSVEGHIFHEKNFTRLLRSNMLSINKPLSIVRSHLSWHEEQGYLHTTPFQLLMICYNGKFSAERFYTESPDPRVMTFEKLAEVCVKNGARIASKNALGENFIEFLTQWIANRLRCNRPPLLKQPTCIMMREYIPGPFKDSSCGTVLNALFHAYQKHVTEQAFYEEIAEVNWIRELPAQQNRDLSPLFDLHAIKDVPSVLYADPILCLTQELPTLCWKGDITRRAPYAFNGNVVTKSKNDKMVRKSFTLPESIVSHILAFVGNDQDRHDALSVIKHIRAGGTAKHARQCAAPNSGNCTIL